MQNAIQLEAVQATLPKLVSDQQLARIGAAVAPIADAAGGL